MQVSKKTHAQVRIQNIIFVVLLLTVIALLGWLSTRYHFQSDWTATSRNTLSEASIALAKEMEGPVEILAFAREIGVVRQSIIEMISRYQRYKNDIKLTFINPETSPDKIREHDVSLEGELVISYAGKKENLQNLTEQGLTNVLQRLARGSDRWLVFLEGHGERSTKNIANHDISEWTKQLQNKGFNIQPLNLSASPYIPDNIATLIIASPQSNLLPGETNVIRDYIDKGGNLLWLAEPDSLYGLAPIAEQLGINFHQGVIVEPSTQLLGISDPRIALVGKYSPHPITQGFETLTLFPLTAGMDVTDKEGWENTILLNTLERSWLETSPVTDSVTFDPQQDISGPITLGVTMTRTLPVETGAEELTTGEQRITIIGDGDFLSNSYLGNGGNLELGINIINWLSHDDRFIAIPPKVATDQHLELSTVDQVIIALAALILIPGGLLVTGVVIWLKRRRR